MAEAARLYGLLQASAARNAYHNKALEYNYSPYALSHKRSRATATPAPQHQSNATLSTDAEVGLHRVLDLLNKSISCDDTVASGTQVKDTTQDVANDIAVENCKRILTVRSNVNNLKTLAHSLGISVPSPAMAGRFPVLSTSNLPQATPEEQSATASPARGTAMLNSIFKSVRVPEFRHKWMFWAEKGQQATPKDKSASSEEYASRPKPLGDQIISVKEFYQHFNNIPVENLKLRDSIHLFHMGIKPVWEDPRNTRGGAWYFKIPKDIAAQFWHEMCLLAVGDGLQGAVETKRACKSLPPFFFSSQSLTCY
jgi:hypothetical protein